MVGVMTKRSILFYILYAIFAFLVFLIILFPGKPLAPIFSQMIDDALSQNGNMPHDMVTIDDIQLAFPRPGATLHAIRLTPSPMLDPLDIDRLSLFPKPFTMLSSKKSIDLKAFLYNGVATGNATLYFPSPFFTQPPETYSIHLDFNGINIQGLTHRMNGITLGLSFNLRGNVICQGDVGRVKKKREVTNAHIDNTDSDQSVEGSEKTRMPKSKRMTGSSHLVLTHTVIQSSDPFMRQIKLATLKFDTLTADLTFENDAFHIRDLNAAGQQLNIGLKGTILMRTPMDRSLLNLEGELTPKAEQLASLSAFAAVSMLFGNGTKGLPFHVKGTLGNPQFGF